jgi:hypothetical protein
MVGINQRHSAPHGVVPLKHDAGGSRDHVFRRDPLPYSSVGIALALTLTFLAPAPLTAAANDDDDVITAPPVLVSTTADGPDWETIPELIAAAHEGDPQACFQYAQLLEIGDGVPRSESSAFRFYQHAAEQGHPDALFRIGKALHDGLLGQETDHARAFTYYRKAALAEIPEATYNVGAMLVSGRGVKRSYSEGLAWLMLAAEQGTDPGSVDQVKERIKSRPQWIARAEKRLVELKQEIASAQPEDVAASPTKTDALTAPPAPAVVKPNITAPTVAKPTLPGPAAPSISAPKVTLPPPQITPPPAKENE